MPDEKEKQKNPELEQWLVQLNPGLADYFRGVEKSLEESEKKDPNNPALKAEAARIHAQDIAGAKAEAGRQAKAKADKAREAKELLDWERKSGQSIKALEVLMNGLQTLGDEGFLKAHNSYQALPTSGEPTIDKLLGEVDGVFKLWVDPKTLPDALASWKKTEPILLAILAEGQKHFDSDGFGASRNAISRIGKYLGVRLAYKEEGDLVQTMDTPDVGEALDLRELKKLEPALVSWQGIVKQAGRLGVKDGYIKKLSAALDVYFSVHDLKEKLEAFKKAGLSDKIRTVSDVVVYLESTTAEAAKGYYEAAEAIAEKAGKEEAAKVLGKKAAGLGKVVGVLAIYELGKSVVSLIDAIDKGDWHGVAASGFGVASSAVTVAEGFGVISSGTAAGATGALFIVWAEVDTIMGVAELVAWAKLDRAFRATKKLAEETRKIVPAGKKMAAAAQLMIETSSGQDSVEAGKYEVYEKQAKELAGAVDAAITALGGNHVFRTDLDSVGGYPLLVAAMGSAAHAALRDSQATDPMSVTQRFQTVLLGIKSLVKQGDLLFGDAG